MFVCMTEYNI